MGAHVSNVSKKLENSFETNSRITSMDQYKVGGLLDLFSKSSTNDDIIDELFQRNETTTTIPENVPQSLKEEISSPETKKDKKKKAEKNEKKDEEEEDEVKYTQPSKKYKVRNS